MGRTNSSAERVILPDATILIDYLQASATRLLDGLIVDAARMRADIQADQSAMRARYVASKRHTIQVDFDDYLRATFPARLHPLLAA